MAISARAAKTTFRQSVAVTADIAAPPARVWALLTDSAGFPKWNSTVTSIEGAIVLGSRLVIRAPGASRAFTPRVVLFEPERRMIWRDGAAPMFVGARSFELAAIGAGKTRFSMEETFQGVMMPLIAGSLPDFKPIFERYAEDLRHAAEAGGGTT